MPQRSGCESTWPLREVIDRIVEAKTPLIKASTHPYFRDVRDHAVHAIDSIETFRDIVSGILDSISRVSASN